MSGLDSNRQLAPSFLYSGQAFSKALAWSSKADAEVSGLISLTHASAASFSINKHNAIDTTVTEQSTTAQGLIRLMTKEAHEFERQVEKLEELQILLNASKEQLLGFASEDLPSALNHPTSPLAPVSSCSSACIIIGLWLFHESKVCIALDCWPFQTAQVFQA
ncbi:hypothetical protein CPB97_000132 [Podila verticillata]|nr:hypothetical protein CPB97_000132 [Podila verticillata]